mgnify:CR=1 FL=1
MSTEIKKLTQILKESNNIVFFRGAGVTTETYYKFNINKKSIINENFHL